MFCFFCFGFASAPLPLLSWEEDSFLLWDSQMSPPKLQGSSDSLDQGSEGFSPHKNSAGASCAVWAKAG